jgi:hypothetical protein
LESTLMKNIGEGGTPAQHQASATEHRTICATQRLYPLWPHSIAHTSRHHAGVCSLQHQASSIQPPETGCAIEGSFRVASMLALWVQRRARGDVTIFRDAESSVLQQGRHPGYLQPGQPLPRRPDGLRWAAPLWFKNICAAYTFRQSPCFVCSRLLCASWPSAVA